MITMLRHRGPDETGIYRDAKVALGHTRLSIVGISSGTQPISNEDETLWTIYNGEIFNYPELRADLEKRGHLFKTETDTEILVHLYEEYGAKGLGLLNGQFAFAIWDPCKNELFLARDRVGIRPLYYHSSAGKFLFASEIKALFLDPSLPREIDLQSLNEVFTFWTTSPSRTAFKGIRELPPGHSMLVKDGKIVHQEQFWTIPYSGETERRKGSFADASEELRELLLDAVRIRLRADVPVGAYLSGGLDSSVITALIANNFNNNLRTFSVGFQDEAFDETAFQTEMIRHLKTDHSQILISNAQIRDEFPRVVWHCEKPLLRTAPVPMCLLSRLVRESNFKVVLTGEGADELFGGYNIFLEAKIRQFWGKNPASHLRPLLLERLYPYIFQNPARSRPYLQRFFDPGTTGSKDPVFSHRIRWENTGKNASLFFSQKAKQELEGHLPIEELTLQLPEDFSQRDLFSRAQYLEMQIFLSNYLLSSQGDRVGMANSVESRFPFLDYRVIEFAMSLPSAWKIKVLNGKYILKKAFSDMVPRSIVSRPKQPYRAPIREVFFPEAGGYADKFLSEGYLRKTGYFDPVRAGHLAEKFRERKNPVESENENMALTGILSTQILHHQFIEDFDPGKVLPHQVDKRVIR
jgi:asparagine synthase (glutamine-hydrolysing)